MDADFAELAGEQPSVLKAEFDAFSNVKIVELSVFGEAKDYIDGFKIEFENGKSLYIYCAESFSYLGNGYVIRLHDVGVPGKMVVLYSKEGFRGNFIRIINVHFNDRLEITQLEIIFNDCKLYIYHNRNKAGKLAFKHE